MAPTKANATYAVTTLSLLTKGPNEDILEISLVHVAARCNAKTSKPFPAEKVSSAVAPRYPCHAAAPITWLKTRENKALKSP
jgi:hypothetical protein